VAPRSRAQRKTDALEKDELEGRVVMRDGTWLD
jgi:hypothetical protein